MKKERKVWVVRLNRDITYGAVPGTVKKVTDDLVYVEIKNDSTEGGGRDTIVIEYSPTEIHTKELPAVIEAVRNNNRAARKYIREIDTLMERLCNVPNTL